MSNPNFILTNPALTSPVTLQTQPGPAAETAYQVSNGEYFFQLASGGSANRNTFKGAVVIEDPDASLVVQGQITGTQVLTPAVTSSSTLVLQGVSQATLASLSGTATVTAPAVNINATGQISFTTESTTLPMTVKYGVAGATGFLYDSVSNAILKNTTTPVASYNQAFTTIYDGGFTPAVTGFYLITQTMTYGGAITYAPEAYVTSFLTLTNGSLNTPLANSQVVFPMTFTATGAAPTAQTYQTFVFLTAGQIVYNDIGIVGSVNLGSGGGLVITAQPFACFN
tara:strand:- start:1250 stop:2098 length:849 start_codon:yes stop_codon:yes gene_type:complete